MSAGNLKPRAWGGAAWRTLHAIALAYPNEPTETQQQAAIQLFNSLEHMLPCDSCRQHLRMEMQKHPVEGSVVSSAALQAWLGALHNRVNVRLGAPERTYDLGYLVENDGRSSGDSPSSSAARRCVMMMLVVLLLLGAAGAVCAAARGRGRGRG